MKRFFVTLITMSFLGSALAQEDKKIEPERPSETENGSLVPARAIQVEAGLRSEKETESFHKYQLPEALIRYGVSKVFELRFEAKYTDLHYQLIPNPKEVKGLEPVEIGVKVALMEEKKIIPKSALILQLGIPHFASEPFKADHLAPKARLSFENHVSQKITLGYNVGAEFDGTETDPTWLYTISPGFEIGKRWWAFVEAYGYLKKDETPENSLDAGIAFYASKNFRIDLSSGFGISKEAPKSFIAIGGAIRFK